MAICKPAIPNSRLTNGMHIIGALSRPKIEWTSPTTFYSNFIVANIRAISGSAVDKYPQPDATILEGAFSYRLIPENNAYVPFDPYSTNYLPSLVGAGIVPTNAILAHSNYCRVVSAMMDNSHDLRLTFRWPLLPNDTPGPSRHTFREFTGGRLIQTNDPSQGVLSSYPLYFLRPSTYVQK